jgi:hypothetical protein
VTSKVLVVAEGAEFSGQSIMGTQVAAPKPASDGPAEAGVTRLIEPARPTGVVK